MKYYATIDTNVVVSSMLKNDSIPGKILKYVDEGIITPILNEEIFNEYDEVLKRNGFGFTSKEIDYRLKKIKEHAIYLDRLHTQEEFIDKNDIVFYEIVMCSRKSQNTYLITGNIKHFPIKPFIVTPKAMIDIIEGNNQES